MAKFLKVILFLVLATAFCGSVSDAFTVQTVDEMVIAAQVSLGEEGIHREMMFGKEVIFRLRNCHICQMQNLQVPLELLSCLPFHVRNVRIQQNISFR